MILPGFIFDINDQRVCCKTYCPYEAIIIIVCTIDINRTHSRSIGESVVCTRLVDCKDNDKWWRHLAESG